MAYLAEGSVCVGCGDVTLHPEVLSVRTRYGQATMLVCPMCVLRPRVIRGLADRAGGFDRAIEVAVGGDEWR